MTCPPSHPPRTSCSGRPTRSKAWRLAGPAGLGRAGSAGRAGQSRLDGQGSRLAIVGADLDRALCALLIHVRPVAAPKCRHSRWSGVAVGGALLRVAVDLAHGGSHIDRQRRITRPGPPTLGAGYSPLSWSSWRTWPKVKRPRVASTDRLALDEAQDLPTLVVYVQGSGREDEPDVLRYRSNTWIASVYGLGDRRTVSPTRTTSRTLPPGNGCSIPTPVIVPGR